MRGQRRRRWLPSRSEPELRLGPVAQDVVIAKSSGPRWLVFARRSAGLLLAAVAAFLLALAAHRWLDTLGAAPVQAIRPLGPSESVPAAGEAEFLETVAALTETPLAPGHEVEVITDGPATFARLWDEIARARHSVALQAYYCGPGQVTDTLKTLLITKAREGVSVLFLRDGFGCASLRDPYLDSLRTAGVDVAVLRPLHWYSLHRAQHRSHVRAVVIDGRIGYTGGFGLDDKWLPDPSGAPGWRETSVRFTGPAVQRLQAAFATAWAEATGELLVGERVFPPSPRPPEIGPVAGLLYTTRTLGTSTAERYLALTLAGARRSVYITNAYFIPNRSLRDWLKGAAERGVDVRVLTASRNIDVKLTRWAARSHYVNLLAAGVRIYEYQPSMLHAKSIIVDGVWGSVGSLNLDNVSLRLNDEANLLVHDRELGVVLDSIFFFDLERSEEIDLKRFGERPWTERVRELVARFVCDLL